MLLARRSSSLVLLFGIGTACGEAPPNAAPPDPAPPEADVPPPWEPGVFGGQTGSGGAPAPLYCSDLGDGCGRNLGLSIGDLWPRLGKAEWVQSQCVAASRLDASLPGDASVCQCDFAFPHRYDDPDQLPELAPNGEGPLYLGHSRLDLGLAAAQSASGIVRDPCEVRQTYLTDSVCLFSSTQFSGCSQTEWRTSCAETCELVRTRAVAEADARLGQVEVLGGRCDTLCGTDYCLAGLRLGDRCYAANSLTRYTSVSLGEVSCELPVEQMQSPYLALDIVYPYSCSAEQTPPPVPPPYCTRGPQPSVLLSDPTLRVTSMALDATHLYWATEDALFRQPKAGGLVERVIEAYNVDSMAVVSGTLYWHSPPDVYSLALEVGIADLTLERDATRLARDANVPGALAVTETQVYYMARPDNLGNGHSQFSQTVAQSEEDLPLVELRAVPSGGGTPLTLVSERNLVSRLAADSTGLYWNQLPLWFARGGMIREPGVRKYAFADQAVTTFADTEAPLLLTAGDRVVWGREGYAAWSSRPDGSDSVELGAITSIITSEGTTLYSTSTSGGGNIVGIPVGGGERQLSDCVVFDAGSQTAGTFLETDALLADESALYFRSRTGGLIVRLPKPLP